ncbi:MAG: PAS domain S-box protein [Candidatus Marinimicrobia bacterium]|nr:PAS domain S-box protein [Candidatus Neomarinimicrobiota bacterium]
MNLNEIINKIVKVEVTGYKRIIDLSKDILSIMGECSYIDIIGVGFVNKVDKKLVILNIYESGNKKYRGPLRLSPDDYKNIFKDRDHKDSKYLVGRVKVNGYTLDNVFCITFKLSGLSYDGLIFFSTFNKESIEDSVLETLSGILEMKFRIYLDNRITGFSQYEKEMLDTLLKSIPDGIFFKDKQSRFILISDYHAKRLGLSSPEKAYGKTDYDFFDRKFAEESERDEKEVIQKGKSIVRKEELIETEGKKRWVSVTKVPMFNREGDIIGLVGISRDITQIKNIEEELRREKEKFERIFFYNPEPMVYMDRNFYILEVNKRFEEVFGWKMDEVRGKFIDDVMVPDEIREEGKRLNKMSNTGYIFYDTYRKRRDGKKIPVSISAVSIFDKGEIVGRFAIYKDVSARVKAENMNIAFFEISNAVYTKRAFKDFLEEIHSSMKKVVDVENIFFTINHRGKYLSIPYYNCTVPIKFYGKRLLKILSREVMRNEKMIILSTNQMIDVIEKSDIDIENIEYLPKLAIGLPLKVKRKIVGAMIIFEYMKNSELSKEVRTLEEVAVQIAIALKHKIEEYEREKLLRKLRKALREVKELSGLLPICANCKKIRDDQGYWNDVEKYISENTDVDFTHSICPDCMKKLYSDIYKELYEKAKDEGK